jgi:hypothetical protein
MEAKWPSKVSGDPRKEEAVVKYKRPTLREEDQDPDLRSIASLGLGMAGLFTKNSLFSWAALLFSISAMCCMVHPQINMKQASTALMFSLSGLVSSYLKVYQTKGKES